MTDRLKGKLSVLDAENRILQGKYIQICRELNCYRDRNLVAYSEQNRGLKEELEKLKDVQKQLEDARAQVSKQNKFVADLPKLTEDLKAALERAEEAEAAKEEKSQEVERLKADKTVFTQNVEKAAMSGFKRCLTMAMVLEPGLNTNLLDAKYKAEDGKIVHKDTVIYDPAAVPTAKEETAVANPAENSETEGRPC